MERARHRHRPRRTFRRRAEIKKDKLTFSIYTIYYKKIIIHKQLITKDLS